VLLHLVLLGAIDGGIGDARGEKPATAAVSVRIRAITLGAPAAAPAAEPSVERQAAPAPPATLAPTSPATATSPHAGAGWAPRAVPTAAPAKIASARSPGVPANPNDVETPPSSTEQTPPSTVISTRSNEPAIVAAEPPDAFDVAVETPAEPAWVPVALDTARTAPAAFLSGERPPPTYRTVLPPPAILRYELRRGILRGTGEIRWRPAGDRYALQFEARLAGFILIAQSSQGELAAHGLAPIRFVEQRARKPARSVNFSRDSATISFSASTARWPLVEGTQDRLSWMIQLGGIVAADPSLASTGRISMVLVSARGEASVRTARFAGRDMAETAAGDVPALKFVVDGHSAYDGSFEIWLDPARGYLPARAVSRASSGDAEFELLLQRADP